jgi:hypothetical protein
LVPRQVGVSKFVKKAAKRVKFYLRLFFFFFFILILWRGGDF